MIQWPLHLKLGFKMVVPPWLRKPPFNDVLIDHMSDVPLVSNMSGCFSTPIMAARISPCVPSFSLGVQSQFSVSCSQLEISSQAWFKCSFERLNHFSAIVWFSKPTHFIIFYHIQIYDFSTVSYYLLLSIIFHRHLSHVSHIHINFHQTRLDLPVGHLGNLNVDPSWRAFRFSAGGQILQQGPSWGSRWKPNESMDLVSNHKFCLEVWWMLMILHVMLLRLIIGVQRFQQAVCVIWQAEMGTQPTNIGMWQTNIGTLKLPTQNLHDKICTKGRTNSTS